MLCVALRQIRCMGDSSRRSLVTRLPSRLAVMRTIAAMLAPPVCALCGGRGQWLDEPWGLDLCEHCEQACPRWQPEALPFESAFCLFRYTDPVDLMITRLKFREDLVFARVLGMLFARAWRTANRDRPECIVPMPLHTSRYRERGFCQTTEIARHIAPRLGLPIRSDLLQRVRATRAQSGLSAGERVVNLRGAFRVVAGRHVPRHVAVLDDVLTTGHTALAAFSALRDAGIERIDVWCCARA